MKKQLLIVLFLSVLLIVLKVVYVNSFYTNYHPPISQIYQYKLASVNKKNQDYKNLILGDSKTLRAVNATILPSTLSLASTGATPIEMFYLLKRYLKNNKKPKTILASFSFQTNMKNKLFFWDHYVYYGFYEDQELDEIQVSSYKNQDFPALNLYQNTIFPLKKLLYKLKVLPFDLRAIQKSFLNPYRIEHHQNLILRFDSFHGSLPLAPKKKDLVIDSSDYDFSKFRITPVTEEYLLKILDLCAKNNIKLIFFTPPIHQTKSDQLIINYYNNLTSRVNKLIKDYPSAHQLTDILSYSSSFFDDEFHLNKRGANEYTQVLKQALEDIQ